MDILRAEEKNNKPGEVENMNDGRCEASVTLFEGSSMKADNAGWDGGLRVIKRLCSDSCKANGYQMLYQKC